MVHRGGIETSSEQNKKDDFNTCLAEDAKTADDETYVEHIEELTTKAKQTKGTVKKASLKSTPLPLTDHSISQTVVRVERSRFIKKKNQPNSKPDTSAKSICISPVRAGLRSNSLESHTSTTSNNNNAKGKKKKVNNKKGITKPIDSPPQETVNPISDDSQTKLSQELPLTFICSLPLDRLSGILENLKIDKTLTKCLPSNEEDTSVEDKLNVDQNSSQCKTLCLYCDKRMSTVKVRARHIERFHTISKERRSSTRNPVTSSQDSKDSASSQIVCSSSSSPSTPKSSSNLLFSGCSFCSKSPKLQAVALETDLNALFYHLVDIHSDKYFGCKICAIRFQNAAKLEDHAQRTHTQPSKNTLPAGDVISPLVPDEERSVSDFGKSTPTKTRRQLKQTSAESAKATAEVLSPPIKAGSSASSSSVSRNGSMFSTDEPILSRLGVTQNRLPRGRKGIRSRRQTNVDGGVKPDNSLINVKTRSKVGKVCTSSEPIETVFRTPTNTRTEPLSCTFDEDFYEKVFINVRNNLSCHLDGKLGNELGSNCPQSPPPLLPAIRSTVVKSPHIVESEVHTATSLAALTAFPTLLTAEQYGCDFGTAKIKRPITKHSWKWKWDSVKKYKYVNEGGKIVKKIKQPMLGLRDLSKLDMWTQLTMRQKHEVVRKQAHVTSSKCVLEFCESSREEKQKQVDQLNTILDSRRMPQIVLEQNEQTIIKLEITDEGLRYLAGEMSSGSTCEEPSTSFAVDRIVPANLNLIPSRSLVESLRHTVVLSGEWARPRCYVCFGCGARFDKLKALEEHKMFRHPHVYSTHYEIVGRELIEGNLYKHFFIPLKALSRHREYAQRMLVNKKTEDHVSKSSNSNSGNEEESLDSLHSVTASFTTLSSSKLSDDCDTDTKTAIENVSPSLSYTEPSSVSVKNDSSSMVVSSFSVHCTKCNRNCHGILELYRHMLDCSGDYAWLLAKKKKYRYYGSRKRRQFNKHSISTMHLHKRKMKETKDENESDATPKKKPANMSPSTPRPRPSDADSIRKMLENLPPKRVCREIIPNATKPRSRKFKTAAGRKMQQNAVNKKCKSSNTTLTAISKKLLRNHKLRAISEKEKISRNNKLLENKRKSTRVNSTGLIVNKKSSQSTENVTNKKTDAVKGGIVRKIGATTKRFVKKIKKRLLGKKQSTNTTESTADDVEKTAVKKLAKLSAVRKLTFDKEKDAGKKQVNDSEEKPFIECKQTASTIAEIDTHKSKSKKAEIQLSVSKEQVPTITIESDCDWKKSQDAIVSENTSLKSEGSMENLHQQQRELSTSAEDLQRLPSGFLQNQVSPTTKRRSKKINDCIAMLTGKLQEKLGKPFLECKETGGNVKSQINPEVTIATVPPSNENKDNKLPKRKALSRRIVKCDVPVEANATTKTKPKVTEQSETKHPVTKPSVTEAEESEPSVSEPSVSDPLVPEPLVSKPLVSEPLVLEPTLSVPRVTESPVTKPATTKHPVAKPAVTKAPVIKLPVTEPSIKDPLVETPIITERLVIEPVLTKHLGTKSLVAKSIVAKNLVTGPSLTDLPFAVPPSPSGPPLLQPTLTGYSVKEPPQTKAPSMEITAALNQFISASTRKAPPPVVTVEITTPPHIEIAKKIPAERKQPPKQQCFNNADIIRVPCIKPPQLTIPQFTPVQIPAPRGMITKRRQTIAGAPNDFLSEINSLRCANTYNNLPFELEVPLDLSKKPKRSSPKAKVAPKVFPPHHHPQISVKSNAVLMPPMPFPLPILPQTQIIPIMCESMQPNVSQIPLQSPPLMFQNEHPKTNTSLPRKRVNNNKKQETVMSTILSPPFINLTVDSPSPKKVPKKPIVTAERNLKSNVVVVPPAAKTTTLIREPILILPGAQLTENTANEVKDQPRAFEKIKRNTPAVQNLGCDVVSIASQEAVVKVPSPPTLDISTETEIEKCVSISEKRLVEELLEIKSPNEVKRSNAIKEPNEMSKPNEIEASKETKKSNNTIESNEIRKLNEIKETQKSMESKETMEPKETMKLNEVMKSNQIMKPHEKSKETNEPSRTNTKYSQAAPKKGSTSSAASSTTNQSDKQLEAVAKIDKKVELSPESQKSFPTRRSRRNKMTDQKAVADDVRPSALKEVEAIAASFLSEDEQENEDIMPNKSMPQPEETKRPQASKSENIKPDKIEKSNEFDAIMLEGTKAEKPTTNKKASSSGDIQVIPVSDDKDKETTTPNNQDASKKPRRRRKNELAAIVADQLMESFKEVDKSRIDDLKRLENLAYEKSEDLLLTGMRLMPTTKRKNVLDNKKEIITEQESKVPPAKEAKKQKAEAAKEKKIQKNDGELFKEPNDAQKVDVKVKNQKEDVEVSKIPNCNDDLKAKPLPINFGNYRTNSVDSWSHRGLTQNNTALLSPENEKSPNMDLAFAGHKKNRKKQMKKRDKKIEIENINQLRSGLESFTLSKGVADDVKEDSPPFGRTMEPPISIAGLFTPTQRNPGSLSSVKEPEASAFASLSAVKSSSSILRPSILAASLDIATNKDNASQSERKSSISSRDPRLNKNIHTEEGDTAAVPPETLSRLSTLRQRRKSLADVTAPTQHTSRANTRSASTKRSEANSRRNSMAFDDDDDDNYLTAIAKRVNDKIMSAEDKDFNLANDGFDLANSFLDIDDPFGRPSTSMSVRSAPNFNDDRSNMDTMDATNTDLIDMDVDDDMSVYTTFSQDTSRSTKGRRRRRRRSVLLTRKPKKTNVNTMEPTETFVCLLCNKTFAKSAALNKHQLTIAHVTKLSEQEYLNATRKQEEAKQAPPPVSSPAKVTTKTKTTDVEVVEIVKPHFNAIPMLENIISQKLPEVNEKLIEKVEKTPQPKLPYIPPNSILNQSGIEPISSPEQNYERYSTKTLNPDERLFYECCNILKGSETPQVERNYPIVPPTAYAYDLQVKPVTPKSTNERFSYIKQSTAEASGKRESGAYPRLDINQFSDISSDSNPACAQPPPVLPISYAQMHVLSGAKDQAVLPNDEGNGGALRSNIHRENPILQISSLVSSNPVAPLTARTFVNQPSQIGAHLYGMESAATVTQKQNFISPLHSASSQSSTITTTTCRLKTKAAMKGYDNLKVSIPTIGLDMEHALERSPRAGCKLTTLAEIALGNETPLTAITSFTPAMQMHCDQKSKCKAKANFLVEQFPTMLNEPKANQTPPIKVREKSPVKIASPVISIHDTESCMPIVLSPPKKPEGITAKDIYEFDDSENTPISKAIQSPFKLAEDNDGSPKKAIIIPERPFKNIGREEQEGIKFQKPETPAINDDNTTSTVTYSDRDDFVYGSISEGDDDNDNEDNKDGNMNSEESSNSSAFTAKTFENKSLIMGRIFKNAKTKPKTPVEKPKLPTPEPPKLIPKQELDRLFDTLRGLNENRQTNAVNEERLENAPNSSRTRESQAAKRKTTPKAPKTKASTNKQCKKLANKEDHCSKEIAQLHAELGMSPAEIAELIGEGQRKSQRRCAVNRPKKLVEIWSSDEFEEFLSTKDIIALIEEKEQKTKRKKKTSTTSVKKSTMASPLNDTKSPDKEKATTLQSEDEKASSSSQKPVKNNPKAATENTKKTKPPKGKKKGPIATANVMPPPKLTSKVNRDVKSATPSRRDSIDASKTKVIASPFKKPRSVSKAADDSESDFETELHRKTKGAPIRNRRKTISGKLENDAGSSSSVKKESGKSKIASESVAARKSSTTKPPPADSQSKPQARRKRIASEMLYYWSSSSDEEFGLIESTHDDEDHIEESENYQQHGWIVGDSHKKLVTLLAIAKGNKKVDDCGVKETNSKKKS